MALIFLDETGLSQQPVHRRTWAPRGRTPIVTETFNWKKLSALIAIATTGDVLFEFLPGSVTASRVLCFLVDLLDHFGGRPVMLFWDGAPIHRTGEIADFLNRPDVRKRLEVHRLPPYAPDLNPEGLLNAHLKAHALANRSPETLGDLQREAEDHLRTVNQTPGLVASFLTSHRHELLTERDLVKLSFKSH
jgi:transposase